MKEIRFAAIPKCASRSLKALGLLGELNDKRHSKITEYPNWQRFEWYYVERDPEEWYKSWWLTSHDSAFAKALGMQFKSLEDDLKCFKNTAAIGAYGSESGVNEWVPEANEFFNRFLKFTSIGLGFKEYCFATIINGVSCKQVHISRLDSWLVARGFSPVHENVRQGFSGVSPEDFANPHPDLLKLAQQLIASKQLPSFMKTIGDLASQKPMKIGY